MNKISLVLTSIFGAALAVPAGAQPTSGSAAMQQTNAEQIAALHQQVQTLKQQEASLEGPHAQPTHNSTNFHTSPDVTKARLDSQISALQARITSLQSKNSQHAKHNTEMLK